MGLDRIEFLPSVVADFKFCARMSGLHLMLPKIVIIPLWQGTVRSIRRMLADDYPSRSAMDVACSVRYLGILLGPGADETQRSTPTDNFLKVASRWARGRWGTQMGCYIWNISLHSILTFVAQFAIPFILVVKAEQRALPLVFPGPANWIMASALFQFKTLLASPTLLAASCRWPKRRNSECTPSRPTPRLPGSAISTTS